MFEKTSLKKDVFKITSKTCLKRRLEKDVFLKGLVRKLEKRLDSSNTETVDRSVKIKRAVDRLNDLSSEIDKFGKNIRKDHPDAEILTSQLSIITSSIKKIKDDLQLE